MSSGAPALVIVNPMAGHGRRHDVGDRAAALAQAVARTSAIAVTVRLTDAPGHARMLATEAVGAGVRLVVAWGGDGTVNETASALLHTETSLGIVPGGSGNGLGRDLGLPLDPAAALQVAFSGRERVIDAGRLNDRPFFNVAGLGLDGRVAQRFADMGRVRRGVWGYVRATLDEVLHYAAVPVSLDIDGTRVAARPLIVAFANGRQYGNGALVAPDARVDDGCLDVVVIGDRSLLGIARGVPALFLGRLARQPGVAIRRGRRVTATAAHPLTCHVDGEPVMGGTRVDVEVLPQALRVRVPPGK